jgi:hypothetical protein
MKRKTTAKQKHANNGSTLAETSAANAVVQSEWPLPSEEVRRAIVNRQVRAAIDPEVSNRDATSAARCLVAMHAQNLQEDAQSVTQVGTQNIFALLTRQELLNDPEYLEWLRSRAVDDDDDAIDGSLDCDRDVDRDAGPVRQNGQPRKVETGQAPPSPRPGHNRHARGG